MGIFSLARSKFNLDDQTEDLDIGFFEIVNEWLVFRIGRLRHQCYDITAAGKALEGCVLIVDKNGRDLAIFNNILSADNNDVAVKDTSGIHAVAAHAQSEVFCAAVKVGKSVALDIFFGVDRRSCSDAAEDGDAL